MSRTQQRFRLALVVLGINALLLAALVGMAWMGINVTGENILFMAVGSAMTWAGGVLHYYFGTTESSAQKTELLADRPSGQAGGPVHVEEEIPEGE